jgi:hypothetical protein
LTTFATNNLGPIRQIVDISQNWKKKTPESK